MQDVITYYRLVVKDVTNGRRKALTDRDPIRGRYPAEAERDKMQRSNRDPNLRYELEQTSAPQPKESGNESTVLEHHFRDRKW